MFTQLTMILMFLILPDGERYVPPKQPPAPDYIPLAITGYSWNGSDPTGCDSDCSVTAMGIKTSDDLLGRAAACPQEWMGWTLHIPGIGSFWCIDNFGDPENRKLVYDEDWGWVYRIDLALEDPRSAPYGLYWGDYWLEWVDYSEEV
jgi:hypothetical protein